MYKATAVKQLQKEVHAGERVEHDSSTDLACLGARCLSTDCPVGMADIADSAATLGVWEAVALTMAVRIRPAACENGCFGPGFGQFQEFFAPCGAPRDDRDGSGTCGPRARTALRLTGSDPGYGAHARRCHLLSPVAKSDFRRRYAVVTCRVCGPCGVGRCCLAGIRRTRRAARTSILPS